MNPPATPSQALVRVSGQQVSTISDAIDLLKEIPEEQRYHRQEEVLQQLLGAVEFGEVQVETFWRYVQADGAWKHEVDTLDTLIAKWPEAVQRSENSRTRQSRIQDASESVARNWGQEFVDTHLSTQPFLSQNAIETIRSAAIKIPNLNIAKLVLNRAMWARLYPSPPPASMRGRNTTKGWIIADFQRVAAGRITLSNTDEVTEEMASEKGLTLAPNGILKPVEGQDRAITVGVEEFGAGEPGQSESSFAQGSALDRRPAAPPLDQEVADEEFGRQQLQSTHQTGYVETAEEPDPAEGPSAGTRGKKRARLEPGHYAEGGDDAMDEGGSDEFEPEEEDAEFAGQPGKKPTCSCDSAVRDDLLARLERKGTLLQPAVHALLREFHTETAENTHQICYKHTQALASKMHLQTKTLDRRGLIERLNYLHEHILTIGDIKVAPNTYTWFRRSGRPPLPVDRLGPYKFAPKVSQPFRVSASVVLQKLGGLCQTDGVMAAWERDGSVNVQGVFSWWWSLKPDEDCMTVAEIAAHEFNMYHWHLRRINDKDNFGWQRNQCYSLIQQLVRRDPVYYMLYCALRPDGKWRLVSYPYYCKDAHQGDNTTFRHIDLTVSELVKTGRGAQMIQGSVSLDNEDEKNCTEILPGMHLRVPEWFNRITERGGKLSGLVNRITPDLYNNSDAEHFGIQWTKVPCKQGDARITLPALPHGSTGPATIRRRTILPWFVAVMDDHETLEVTEGGTWSMLATAHRDMTAPLATPSGLANRYGKIPYAFPASVMLPSLGPLSDALECRRRWTDPMVTRDCDFLLGSSTSSDEVHEHIGSWRTLAVREMNEAFVVVRQAEMDAFGKRSYFYNLDNNTLDVDIEEDLEEDPDADAMQRDPSEGAGMEFAEQGLRADETGRV